MTGFSRIWPQKGTEETSHKKAQEAQRSIPISNNCYVPFVPFCG
jgi:hypothetical protein